ncbi:MAG: hypothetical protein ACRBN8_36135 [Nannocystales bacterium]
MSRVLSIALLGVCSACQLCDENADCEGGRFNVWVATSDNAPLPEGSFALTVTPDVGAVLHGECMVSSQGTRAECSGDAVAGSVNRRDVFTFLRISQDPTFATLVGVGLTHNGVVVDEREDETLDFYRGDSCDNDCGVADVQLQPLP